MKTSILLFAASATFFSLGCKTCPPRHPNDMYHIVNNSEHTISIVHDPACIELPDSLVLKDGEEFALDDSSSTTASAKPFFFFFLTEQPDRRRILYFDGRYALNFLELPEERKFFLPGRYEKQAPFEYRFTFTEEDYEYAVRHGRDLGE